MKRLLVISNNPISLASNTGGTLYSFFRAYPQEELSQLYIEDTFPDFESSISFYRITDREALFSVKHLLSPCGRTLNNEFSTQTGETQDRAPRGDAIRLAREIVWGLANWNNTNLVNWLRKAAPEEIFFVAGDCAFMHRIAALAQRVTGANLNVYCTDDYILPRMNDGIIAKIRRKMLRTAMMKTLAKSKRFFTISDEMRELYLEIFDKDSTCVMNIPAPFPKTSREINSNCLNLLYCGNIRIGREEILEELGKAIAKYNNKSEKKAFLSVYSRLSSEGRLNTEGASAFKGQLSKDEVAEEISKADILVHAESFDDEYRSLAKLSVSTKIPEYLSSGKPILAIGPEEVASMLVLRNHAACITDLKNMEAVLERLFEDDDYRNHLSVASLELYRSKFEPQRGLVSKMMNE